MDLFVRLDVNIIALIILSALFLNNRKGLSLKRPGGDLFSRLTLVILLATVIEMISFAVDGRPGRGMYAMSMVSNTLLFVLAPVTMCLWVQYIEHLLIHDYVVSKSMRILRCGLAGLILVLTVINVQNGILFEIQPGNVYIRGPWFVFQVVVNGLIVAQAYLTMWMNRHRLNDAMLFTLALFPLIPLAGVLIQTHFYGTSAILSYKAVALLLIYINVQRSMIYLDPLTGLENRRSLEILLSAMEEGRPETLYGAMMLDIDNLKMINDLHGHEAGDVAIKRAAEMIRGSLRKQDFVARYAGDEFLVVMEVQDRETLSRAVERIERAFRKFNETSDLPWQLEVSIGCDTFVYKTQEEVTQSLKKVDQLMYQEKSRRKKRGAAAVQSPGGA